MKICSWFVKIALAIALLLAPVVYADDVHGTKDEAQAMAEKAAALLEQNKATPEKAYAQFQDKSSPFFYKDLYVFVVDDKGLFTAHGAKPVLVGKGGFDMKDVAGFALIKAFVDVKDKGWVDYKWPDSADNNKVKDKSSYIIKVGALSVGVGYYK